MKSGMYVRQLAIKGYFVVLARNCPSSTLDYIVKQLRKSNREKAFSRLIKECLGYVRSASSIMILFSKKFQASIASYVKIPSARHAVLPKEQGQMRDEPTMSSSARTGKKNRARKQWRTMSGWIRYL